MPYNCALKVLAQRNFVADFLPEKKSTFVRKTVTLRLLSPPLQGINKRNRDSGNQDKTPKVPKGVSVKRLCTVR